MRRSSRRRRPHCPRSARPSPAPWKMLSPSTRATLSSPMNSSPMMNACARPSGDGCTAYSMRMPSSLPSPSSALNWELYSGVVMTRTSRMPAIMSVDERVVDHRLVVDRHQLLGDALRDRPQAGARAAGEDDSTHVSSHLVEGPVAGQALLPGRQQSGCRRLREASGFRVLRRQREVGDSGSTSPTSAIERVDAVLALGVEDVATRGRSTVASSVNATNAWPRPSARYTLLRSTSSRSTGPTVRRSASRRGCR